MKDTNYFIINSDGELVTEEGESEKDAYETMCIFRQEAGMRGLSVVRFARLSVENQKLITDYEEKLANAIAKMRGRKVA